MDESGIPSDLTRPIGRRGERRIAEPSATPASLGATPSDERSIDSASGESSVSPLVEIDRAATNTGSKAASDLMHGERELEGMRILLAAMAVFAVCGLVGVRMFPGPGPHGMVLAISFVAILVATVPLLIRAFLVTAFAFDAYVVAHVIVVSASVPGVTFGLGMHSAVTGVFALGIMFFAMNGPPRIVIVSFLEITIGHAILCVLAFLHVIPSTGLRIPVELHGVDFVLAAFWVEGVYVAALGIGLLVNRRWAQLVAKLEQAVRVASARDALLREIREELDRAANLVGPGRFTGHDVGSFRLGQVLGRGGMGEVYDAVRIDDGSEAAVKVLRRGLLAERDVVARFQREARTIRELRTPHVTAVLEVGGGDGEFPYIAMERLHGQDLAAMLRAKGTLAADEIRSLVSEVSRGLAVAHEAGIVHRDLKPNNLFHAESGSGYVWKILDFGIAKDTRGVDATLTVDQIVGTPQYMAPEQTLKDVVVDRRVDVHALAVIAYRAFTGRLPWNGPDVARILVAVAHEIPPDPHGFVVLPTDVGYVLRIGLAKRPEDRFPTAEAFDEALGRAMDGNLEPRWRDHARALLASEPWGGRSNSLG